MQKNQFSVTELPDEEQLKCLISNFQYRKMETSELPFPIIENGLAEKFNSVILAASGSSDMMFYSVIGIRPDKGNVIDEHPFVFCYDRNNPLNSFGGIIHHGNWLDRTTPMDQSQIEALNKTGLTAKFTYKSIPPGSSGSLGDLRENGMLEGISDQFDILRKNHYLTS